MPDARAARHPVARVAVFDAGEDAREVEGQRPHPQLAVLGLPLRPGPVAVDLDPVAFRVVEVERLGDEMVGRAGEPPRRSVNAVERTSEIGARGNEERKVEEAGRAWRPHGRIGSMHERDERDTIPGGSELHDVARAPYLAQADRLAVERGLNVEVADRELDGPDRRCRIDRQSGCTGSPTRTVPGCSTCPQTPIGSGSPLSGGR